MHCASCVLTIERALSKTAGVHSASVNFASESASIEFDENIISEQNLAGVVKSVGYHLDVGMNSHQHNHAEMERDDQIKEGAI